MSAKRHQISSKSAQITANARATKIMSSHAGDTHLCQCACVVVRIVGACAFAGQPILGQGIALQERVLQTVLVMDFGSLIVLGTTPIRAAATALLLLSMLLLMLLLLLRPPLLLQTVRRGITVRQSMLLSQICKFGSRAAQLLLDAQDDAVEDLKLFDRIVRARDDRIDFLNTRHL